LTGLRFAGVTSGIKHGFSRSGFGLIAVTLACFTALALPVGRFGFVVVLVGVICGSAAVGYLLGKWLRSSGQDWLDRTAGGILGLTNSLLFSVLVVLALLTFAPRPQRELVARSNFGTLAIEAAWTAIDIMPDEVVQRLEEGCKELGQILPVRHPHSVSLPRRNEI